MMDVNKISYGEENDTNLKLVITLSRAAQTLQNRGARIFKNEGLTPAQFAVLEVLYHKGDLKICEIIQKILSTGGNMTVVINNLEKDKMINKLVDPDDKRSTLVHLTDKGRKKIEGIFPLHVADLNEFFKTFSPEEKMILITLLKKTGKR